MRLALVLAVLASLLVPASALAAARSGTRAEDRAIRAALRSTCETTAREAQVAISRRDARFAIFNWDDGTIPGTCSAVVRRTSPTAKTWRVHQARVGAAAYDRATQPCPTALPRDLWRTVRPRGTTDHLVYCGN